MLTASPQPSGDLLRLCLGLYYRLQMGRQKNPKDPQELLRKLEQGVENYIERRDGDTQFAFLRLVFALPFHGPLLFPAPLTAALLESLRRPLTSGQRDVWLRYTWRARHHRIRADIIVLLLRARTPAAELKPVLIDIINEPWDANVYRLSISGAQCSLRACALRGLRHLAQHSNEGFSEDDVTRIAEMLAMSGWLLALRAAELLVTLGHRAAGARTQIFQYGLVHHKWQVVEASARIILGIDGCYRSDDRLWARLLNHKRWQVRGRVAQVLSHAPTYGASFGPRVLRRLEKARTDTAHIVRKYAQRALEGHASRAPASR